MAVILHKAAADASAILSETEGRARGEEIGASEGIRTLDTHVGNVMLYQAELRSLPNGRA